MESYSGLHAVLESLSLKEYEDFFSKTVPFIQRLIAQFPLVLPHVYTKLFKRTFVLPGISRR